MNKIYKYELPRDGMVTKIYDYVIEWLHVGCQNGVPVGWAVVDTDMPRGQRVTQVVAWGTGWDLPDEVWLDCEYIGTCEDDYGFVWHYFAESADEAPMSAHTSVHADGRSVDMNTVTVDYDALSRIYASKAVNDYTVTFTNGVADSPCATKAICFAH